MSVKLNLYVYKHQFKHTPDTALLAVLLTVSLTRASGLLVELGLEDGEHTPRHAMDALSDETKHEIKGECRVNHIQTMHIAILL